MLLNSVSTRRGKLGNLEFDISLDFYCLMRVFDIEIFDRNFSYEASLFVDPISKRIQQFNLEGDASNL